MKNRKLYTLNPSQSKRLIAKGVAALPQIQEALKNGKIFISRGSTNAFVLEELYKAIECPEEFNKGDYVAGQIIPGEKFMSIWINKGDRKKEVLISKGVKQDVDNHVKAIEKFSQGDIFIKGANAIDIKGIPAVLAGGGGGGTIGAAQGILQAKGIEVICPIGLEKMIFGNTVVLQQVMGQVNMDKPSEGMPCGLISMPYSSPITEIEALESLFDCETYHVSSGGVGGAEGSVTLLVDALDTDEMQLIDTFMNEIALEPQYKPNL
jgi:hypothetical protein